MKLLIISDIHANIAALESVYKKEPSPDKIICAGDLLDYGTHPKEVIAWIREHKVDAVWRETTMSKPSRCTKAGSGVM